jgi:hypothetical protein
MAPAFMGPTRRTPMINKIKLIVLALALALHGGGEQPHTQEGATVALHHRRD